MACAPAYAYNDVQFRLMFSAFADAQCYPADYIQMVYAQAGLYVANSSFGPLAQSGATPVALNLMTAHLLQIMKQIGEGVDSGITIQATIDKISTTIYAFAYPNQWQLWLGSTEYGKQLLALLQVQSVGGFSVIGGPGRAGFRVC